MRRNLVLLTLLSMFLISGPSREIQETQGQKRHSPCQTTLAELIQRATQLAIAEYLEESWKVQEASRISKAVIDSSEIVSVDPTVVLAVMLTESSGRYNARSPKGAMGLMQIMPATAEYLASRSEAIESARSLMRNPEENILAGALYLEELISRYKGNVRLALEGYNWGPTKLDARIREGRSIPRKYSSRVEEIQRDLARFIRDRMWRHLPSKFREDALLCSSNP